MKPQRELYSLPHITTFLLYAITYSASPLILLCTFDINNNNAHILIPIAIYTYKQFLFILLRITINKLITLQNLTPLKLLNIPADYLRKVSAFFIIFTLI